MLAVTARRSLAHRHAVDRLRDHAQRHGRRGGGPVHGALAGKRRHRRPRSAGPRPRSSPCWRRPSAMGERELQLVAAQDRLVVAAATLHAPRDYSAAMHVPGFAFNPIVLLDRGRDHRLPDRRAGRPGGGALHPPLDHRRRRRGLHDRHRRGAGRRGVRRRRGLRPQLRRELRRPQRSLAARHRRRRAGGHGLDDDAPSPAHRRRSGGRRPRAPGRDALPLRQLELLHHRVQSADGDGVRRGFRRPRPRAASAAACPTPPSWSPACSAARSAGGRSCAPPRWRCASISPARASCG